MANNGMIGPFIYNRWTGEIEDWSAYTERLDQYFIANETTTGVKEQFYSAFTGHQLTN